MIRSRIRARGGRGARALRPSCAATTIITQALDDPLYHDYERITEAGTKPNLAKLTLARKIASTALALWKKEECYRPKHRTALEAYRGD